MHTNRRDFIARGAVVAGVALGASPLDLVAEKAPLSEQARRGPGLPILATDRAVLSFASTYAQAPIFLGGGVLGRLKGGTRPSLTVLLRVDDLATMSRALESIPFKAVYAEGDTLSFDVCGVAYRLENLPTAEYQSRLVGLGRRSAASFAHDAVSFDVGQKRLSDPHGSMSGATARLQRVTAAMGLVRQTSQLLRGWVESARFGLVPDAEFNAFRRQTLDQAVTSPEDASSVGQRVLGAMAPLALSAGTEAVGELVGSRLAASSLLLQTGQTAKTVESRYQKLRRNASPADVSDAALWLASVLGPAWRDHGVRSAPITADRLGELQTLGALSEARKFLKSSGPSET